MKQLFFITIFSITSLTCFQLNAQQLTIGGMEGQVLFIGISNNIEYSHPNYSRVKMTLINDNCRFIKNNCSCSKEGSTILLVSDTLNNLIDSFTLTIKRVEVFGVFFKLKDGSLIKPSKRISKQQIQQFKSLYCAYNVPWINLPVHAFDFTLVQNDEVFSFTILKDRIPNEMKSLLPKIEKGAKIYIDTIKIRTPTDDGNSILETFDLNVN